MAWSLLPKRFRETPSRLDSSRGLRSYRTDVSDHPLSVICLDSPQVVAPAIQGVGPSLTKSHLKQIMQLRQTTRIALPEDGNRVSR
jgi:hypothetical protein